MEIMGYLFLFILIGSIIYSSVHYFHFYLMKGDFEDKERYSPFMSFNKTLNKKMEYYPYRKMTWLKIYMNFILPVITIGISYSVIFSVITSIKLQTIDNPLLFIVSIIAFVLSIANVFLFRFLDKTAYILNLVWNIGFFLLLFVFYLDFIALAIFVCCTWGVCMLVNIWYFVKRKELFYRSIKELKKQYE